MITKRIIPLLMCAMAGWSGARTLRASGTWPTRWRWPGMYNAAGADELVFYDITASFEGRALFTDILTRWPAKFFHPAHGGRRHQHAGRF